MVARRSWVGAPCLPLGSLKRDRVGEFQLVVEVHPARSVVSEDVSAKELSCSLCMPSLIICCPYSRGVLLYMEPFSCYYGNCVLPDKEKAEGDVSPKGIFLERMS